MIDSPQYDAAAEAAAELTNLMGEHLPGEKAYWYARILFLILDAVYAAQQARQEPSSN